MTLSQIFLNGTGRCCPEADAVIESTVTQRTMFDGVTESQTVQAYRPIMGTLAEVNSTSRIPDAIGKGKYLGDQKTLAGYSFYRGEIGAWEYETATCKIEIHPSADKEDVETWLQTFKEVESKIIDRGISGGKITFELGGDQYDPEKIVVGQAFASTKLVRFPTAANRQHLLAVCLENGTKGTIHEVSLHGILLHEIGHILAPHLSKEIEFLKIALVGKLPQAAAALKIISPSYLGKTVERKAELLRAAQLSPEITIKGKAMDSETFTSVTVSHLGDEIWAEMVRHYYLEPALSGTIPTHTPTGWKGFDEIASILQREARYNLRNKKGSCPLFPEKRRQASLVPEFIQDMLP